MNDSRLAKAKIAHSEAVEALKRQEGALQAVRDRSLGLVGLAGAAGAVLAGSTSDSDGCWELAGIIAFVVMVVAALYVQIPIDWKSNAAVTFAEDFVFDDSKSEADSIAQLARWYQDNIRHNEKYLACRMKVFFCEVVAFGCMAAAMMASTRLGS